MADRYWVGGSGNWDNSDTTHWASSSGDVGGKSVPTSVDDVFINNQSGFGGGGAISITSTAVNCNNFVANSGDTYSILCSQEIHVYGSLALESGMTISNGTSLHFVSNSLGNTITTAGVQLGDVYFDNINGGWTLQDDLSADFTIMIQNGFFDANDNDVITSNTGGDIIISGGFPIVGSLTVYMGSGNWDFHYFYLFEYPGWTVDLHSETSNVKAIGDNGFFDGGGKNYYNIFFIGDNNECNSSNAFNDFTISAGKEVKLGVGTTQTITGTPNLNGTAGNYITLDSTDGINQFNLSAPSGTINCDYCIIKNSNATGGATWNAGSNSIDDGNNIGWVFAYPPPTPLLGNFNFVDYWDDSLKKSVLLFVNGSSNIYEWDGGITTIKSTTGTTIQKTGSTTWAQEGFAPTGSVMINGTEYTYGSGYDTDTLGGVSPNPTGEPNQSIVFQKIVTTPNGSMTDIPADFENDLIGILKNQVYIGSFIDREVFVSKVNDYKTYTFTSPTRLVGEGALLTLDGCPVGFIPQEEDMYITAGLNDWYKTTFTLSADLSSESLTINKLKTGAQQAAQSQAMIGKMKNSVIFISNEPTLDELGRVEQILGTPQQTNISDPIKNDFDTYDFTDGQVFYYKYFIYVSVPKEGLVLIYNLARQFWEAPQHMPISRFAIIGGLLYGHSYTTPQTFKLFDGYNDNGYAIEASAVFSYQNYGLRAQTKYFNEFYTEGYIQANTTLTLGIKYEIDGCATVTSYDIDGQDTQIVCIAGTDASLGKQSLGKSPLGGLLTQTSDFDLPPKFRVIKTFPRTDFYEVQYSFTSRGINNRWEILAMGALSEKSMYGSNAIKE